MGASGDRRESEPRGAQRRDFKVVLVPPATPAAREEGWQRFVEVVAWLIARGAMDA